MVFDINKSKSNLVLEFYERAMKELCDWYESDWRENKPNLFVVGSKETFVGLARTDKPDWVREGNQEYKRQTK